jgi:hypothetical protein
MSQQQQKPQPDEAREWIERAKSAAAECDKIPYFEWSIRAGHWRSLASLLESQAERIEVLAAALAFIEQWGGQVGEDGLKCTGGWCSEQARAALTAAGVKLEETK